jgi:polyisoprenyl-phosphate glycosyltransferase
MFDVATSDNRTSCDVHDGGPQPLRNFVLSCVVPVHNEGELVASFIEALYACVIRLAPHVNIVAINDGSTDNSAAEILRVAKRCSVHYVELSRNFGKEAAIQAGLDAAVGDCAVVLDADFQHPIELIPQMVARWCAGVDMVYGVKGRGNESASKRWLTRQFYRLVSSDSYVQIPRDAGDFRLIDRKIIDVLHALPERARFMKGLYAWAGFTSEPIPFEPKERPMGASKYSALNLMRLAFTGVTAFSNLPLRAVILPGVLCAIVSCVMGVWIVIERIVFGQPIPGFTTLAAATFLLAGVQLIAIGIVGEYVGRIFDEVKRRPLYVISRSIKADTQSRQHVEHIVAPDGSSAWSAAGASRPRQVT